MHSMWFSFCYFPSYSNIGYQRSQDLQLQVPSTGIHIPSMTYREDLQLKTASRSEKKNHQKGRQEASCKDEERKIKPEERKITWRESWKVEKPQHQITQKQLKLNFFKKISNMLSKADL